MSNTLNITRRFKATRERVFAAFTTVEALKLWLGPGTCGIVSGTADFRVGGSYLMQMKTPDGNMELEGIYKEIDPPSRLSYTWHWVGDEAPVTLVTIELIADGNETEMRFSQTGFATEESQSHHQHGWSGSFDKLDAMFAA